MKKLLIAFILISSSYSVIAQEEEAYHSQRIIQAKTYLSIIYQGATSTNATSARNFYLSAPVLGAAWKKSHQRNFHEIQLSALTLGSSWNTVISNSATNSQFVEARYSYNFAFPITEKYVPYIGAGLQERFSHYKIASVDEEVTTLSSSLILTPGIQTNLSSKWAIDFNLPFYAYQHEYYSIKNTNTNISGANRNRVVGRLEIRLGIAYTL